jgi:hypothetical protein
VSRIGFFILSLLTHALLLLSLLFIAKPESSTAPIQIEITAHMSARTDGQDQRIPAKPSVGKTQIPRARTKLDLGLSTTQAIATGRFQQHQANSTAPQDSSSAEGILGSTLDPYEGMAMPEVRFVRSLWREIDKSIVNSPYLSEYGHFGTVHLSFQVGTDGKLIETTLHAQAEDRVLKVIAARAIRKALLNEKGELSLPTQGMSIHTQFTWSDYQTCSSLRGSTKNYLSFCNYAEDKRKNFSGTEKAAAYLSALQYGFGAIDEIKKYKREEMRRNTHFNPFEEFERDPDWNLGS